MNGVRPALPGVTGNRARGLLSLRDPGVERLISNLPGVEPHEMNGLRRFTAALLRSINQWDIDRRIARAAERGRK
ncbi:MAG: hypothetical protein WBL74_07015 [Novosphingobium sp.]|uniref:hypothetical protein n=1 Tax=Novosphingobium sp. TaxID=1874826 RepID=UPI003C7A4776